MPGELIQKIFSDFPRAGDFQMVTREAGVMKG
jgi:hypothetical protein